MSTNWKRTLPLVLVFGGVAAGTVLAAANDAEHAEPHADATAEVPDVVATVGGEPVTRAELDEVLAPVLADVERQVQDLREQALEQLVTERVLERAAEDRGVTVDALLKAEVVDQVPAPTDAEVEAFFEENQAMIGGASLEEVRPQISQMLQQQATMTAMQAYVDDLRAKADVRTFLQPLRHDVETVGEPRLGAEDAAVEVVLFSDFECPYCEKATDTVEALDAKYDDADVAIVFRNFPLDMHDNARKAAEAAECAFEHGKFWEMHDRIFDDQANLDTAQLVAHAEAVGIDGDVFAEHLASGVHAADVDADLAAGEAAGVRGTPAFYVNGRAATEPTVDGLSRLIDEELAARPAS